MNPALHVERRLVHRRGLLSQLQDPVLPVALGIEPGERGGKRGIVPTAREPRGVVNEAKRAQSFDQHQLAPVEIVEVFVAGENVGELPRHFVAVA